MWRCVCVCVVGGCVVCGLWWSGETTHDPPSWMPQSQRSRDQFLPVSVIHALDRSRRSEVGCMQQMTLSCSWCSLSNRESLFCAVCTLSLERDDRALIKGLWFDYPTSGKGARTKHFLVVRELAKMCAERCARGIGAHAREAAFSPAFPGSPPTNICNSITHDGGGPAPGRLCGAA